MPHRIALAVSLLFATVATAQNDAGNRWPVPDVAPPGTELALELYVTITPAVSVGESGARAGLKPGESIDRSTGEVRDVLGNGEIRVHRQQR